MAYNIDRYQSNAFNPGWPVSVEDGTINSNSTSINLVGKNVQGYGEIMAENLVFMLENFAGPLPPGNAITGQLWYEASPSSPGIGALNIYTGSTWAKITGANVQSALPSNGAVGTTVYVSNPSTKQLYVRDSNKWNPIGGVIRSASAPPNPGNGDFWYDTSSNVLKLFIYQKGWLSIRTLTNLISSNSIIEAIKISNKDVGIIEIDGNVMAMIAAEGLSVAQLPTAHVAANGTTINLQTLFPYGIRAGFNFSTSSNNNFYSYRDAPNNFTINNIGTGKLYLGSYNRSLIEVDGFNNAVNTLGPLNVNSTSHFKVATGTTAERPSVPATGSMRLNTTTASMEYYSGGWQSLALAGGSSLIPPGTAMLFYQANAPTGWTKLISPSVDNAALRVTSGAGGSTGGSVNFDDIFKNDLNHSVAGTINVTVNDHTLTVNEIPSHSHTLNLSSSSTDGTDTAAVTRGVLAGSSTVTYSTNSIGSGQGHSHPATATHSLSFNSDFRVKYINIIVATKD